MLVWILHTVYRVDAAGLFVRYLFVAVLRCFWLGQSVRHSIIGTIATICCDRSLNGLHTLYFILYFTWRSFASSCQLRVNQSLIIKMFRLFSVGLFRPSCHLSISPSYLTSTSFCLSSVWLGFLVSSPSSLSRSYPLNELRTLYLARFLSRVLSQPFDSLFSYHILFSGTKSAVFLSLFQLCCVSPGHLADDRHRGLCQHQILLFFRIVSSFAVDLVFPKSASPPSAASASQHQLKLVSTGSQFKLSFARNFLFPLQNFSNSMAVFAGWPRFHTIFHSCLANFPSITLNSIKVLSLNLNNNKVYILIQNRIENSVINQTAIRDTHKSYLCFLFYIQGWHCFLFPNALQCNCHP